MEQIINRDKQKKVNVVKRRNKVGLLDKLHKNQTLRELTLIIWPYHGINISYKRLIFFILYWLIFLSVLISSALKTTNINFIQISITLAGFVIIGAIFENSKNPAKKELFEISRLFIFSTVLFIVFYSFLTIASSSQNIGAEVAVIIASISWFLAIILFAGALLRLLVFISYFKIE